MRDPVDLIFLLAVCIMGIILIVYMGTCANRNELQKQLHEENMEMIKTIK